MGENEQVQAMTNAIVATLKWIHSHTPEEIAAKMPPELVGKDKDGYIAALKNTPRTPVPVRNRSVLSIQSPSMAA